MIYLDNAATTMRKPDQVVQAVTDSLTSFGGVGRGVHKASLEAGMAVYDARYAIAHLLNAPSASRVSFTPNVTVALNIAINGLLKDGRTALTTAASHNSVLRPLFRARDERGCEVRIVPIEPNGALDMDAYENALEGVDVVVATHASNLTGDVYDIARMSALAHDAGAVFVLDAAQSAGAMPVDMAALGVDVLCFTGHKGLFGPQGTGGLCLAEGVEIEPLFEGGSGTHSFDERHPRFMPEALEAGTINAHGLAGLAAGVAWIEERTPEAIHTYTSGLVERFLHAIADIPDCRVYGGGSIDRCAIVALNLGDRDSALVADALAQEADICTRAGAHCAPLMHKALGTEGQGAVRFSFSAFTTQEEIDKAAVALHVIAGCD